MPAALPADTGSRKDRDACLLRYCDADEELAPVNTGAASTTFLTASARGADLIASAKVVEAGLRPLQRGGPRRGVAEA